MLALRDIETLRMRMADGVHLAADVYRPIGPERHPVLVMRLPYGRKVASTAVLAHPARYCTLSMRAPDGAAIRMTSGHKTVNRTATDRLAIPPPCAFP